MSEIVKGIASNRFALNDDDIDDDITVVAAWIAIYSDLDGICVGNYLVNMSELTIYSPVIKSINRDGSITFISIISLSGPIDTDKGSLN